MSYKNILIAINIFEDYNHVLRTAESICQKFNAKLTLFFVLANRSLQLKQDAKHKLESITKEINLPETNSVIQTGKPTHLIAKYAKEKKHDLIVIGSHDHHGMHLLLGSTSNSLIHKVRSDLLVVRLNKSKTAESLPYRKILLATDFENDTNKLIEKAQSVATHHSASLNALTVIKNTTIPITSSDYGVIPNIRRDLLKETKLNFANWLQKYNIDSKPMCIIGEPAYKVAEYANTKNMDLTIIGNHKKSFIKRLFIGSTVNAILHQIKKDVLVVRLKK